MSRTDRPSIACCTRSALPIAANLRASRRAGRFGPARRRPAAYASSCFLHRHSAKTFCPPCISATARRGRGRHRGPAGRRFPDPNALVTPSKTPIRWSSRRSTTPPSQPGRGSAAADRGRRRPRRRSSRGRPGQPGRVPLQAFPDPLRSDAGRRSPDHRAAGSQDRSRLHRAVESRVALQRPPATSAGRGRRAGFRRHPRGGGRTAAIAVRRRPHAANESGRGVAAQCLARGARSAAEGSARQQPAGSRSRGDESAADRSCARRHGAIKPGEPACASLRLSASTRSFVGAFRLGLGSLPVNAPNATAVHVFLPWNAHGSDGQVNRLSEMGRSFRGERNSADDIVGLAVLGRLWRGC